MKIEINYGIKPNEIGTDFVGLCVDRDGDVWLFGKYDAVCLSTDETHYSNGAFFFLSKEDTFKNAPFTKFNGSVTMEND